MDIEDIRRIAVVECGSINKAAEQLHDYSVAPEAQVRNFEQQLSGKNSSALR